MCALKKFNNCLPSHIKTHPDADDLHQAAIWADNYALIHKSTFRRLPPTSRDNAGQGSATVDQKLPLNNVPPKPVNPKGSKPLQTASWPVVCQLALCAIIVCAMGMLKLNIK